MSGSGGSIPGLPGVRGPGRVPVGVGPRRCSNGRFPGPPPGRDPYGLPCPPGCMGRIGWPGRGPLLCPLPGIVPGRGPRFPVGIGRDGAAGRAAGAPGAAAAGRTAGCVPVLGTGRGAAPPGAGWFAGDAGRIGMCAGGLLGVGVGVGAGGLAAGGALGGVTGVATGFGGPGAALGAEGAGAGAGGAAGAAGLAAGVAVTGAAGFGAAATGAAAGARAGAAGAATGRILAALAAASLASFSAFAVAAAAASAAASASAWPKIFFRTFSATSAGIELECVFFSVTPYPGRRSMIALAFTSSSRANSLMRT